MTVTEQSTFLHQSAWLACMLQCYYYKSFNGVLNIGYVVLSLSVITQGEQKCIESVHSWDT